MLSSKRQRHHGQRPERRISAACSARRVCGSVAPEVFFGARLFAAQLHSFLTEAGFTGIEITIVARDEQNPQFQTVLATGVK